MTTSISTFKEWAELKGFTYWPGGDSEPANLDTKGQVLFRDGNTETYRSDLYWHHDGAHDDIIGYVAKPLTFTLELTPEEAATMAIVTEMIGGDPETSLRHHTDSISNKLSFERGREFGVSWREHGIVFARSSSIYFQPGSRTSPIFQTAAANAEQALAA